MNPNSLLKDQLQDELCVRIINSELDLQTLPKLFLSLLSKGVAVELSNSHSLDIEEFYGSVELQAPWTLTSSCLS